jgi:DNA-directed RNA polymerase subunit RPC12/RpoP
MRCDQIVGEKCAQCGTEATANSNGAVTNTEFDCPSCGHHFLQGDGGETGGLCIPCLEAELKKAYVDAAKSQRRWSELTARKPSRKRLRPISVYRAA